MHPTPWQYGPAGPSATEWDTFVGSGGRSGGGLMHQAGVVVLRPRRLAFIGVAEATTFAKFAGQLALGVAGFVRLRGRDLGRELTRLSRHLAALHPTAVDAETPRWVDHYGGVYLDPSNARVVHQKLPLGQRLAFVADHCRVDVGHASRALQSPALVRLVRAWW